ncbi:MAG TPA: DNA topoisomerase III [Desulfotomaculum sp.]|nr:DNA topoisomerase III [Desulfotomaculum sp.]
MKVLIIAEKPSVARDLAKVLGHFNNREGYLENNDYVVTWAVGHLVTLAEPEDYDAKYKRWLMQNLPVIPERFRLKAIQRTVKQLKVIREVTGRQDIDYLINACDAGREGELIFRYIYRITGCKKPFKRLWLSETTPEAVKKAFASLLSGEKIERLAYAAEARSRADWLIGLNATRAFTVKHNTLLSVGRVQTPTLALIVNREREITNFKSVPYWELYATFLKTDGATYQGKWFKEDEERFVSQEAAAEIANRVQDKNGVVTLLEEKKESEPPPMLFNLNDLQKEANRKYSMTASRTLEVAQDLYEKKKLLTYPRTDSRHMTTELANTIKKRLQALNAILDYSPFAATAINAGVPGKRYVDNGKVSDHTALLPTDTRPDFSKLSLEERNIYDLVARRFLAIFFPATQYKKTRVITEADGETFITTGRVEQKAGWKAVYATIQEKEKPEDDQSIEQAETKLPKIIRGEKVSIGSSEIKEKKTKPQKRYTEATLLAAMEGAGRYLENTELKEAMKGHGLGTPATRAATIERLLHVGYIERKNKALLPTEKGISLIDLVPEEIKSPEMTGRWEKTLADIEEGKADPKEFMAGIIGLTRQIINLVKNQNPSEQAGLALLGDREEIGKCPYCGRPVAENKKGYGCVGYRDGCSFVIWKEIAQKTITANQAGELLKNGRTEVIKGFKARDKQKEFDASLVLNGEGKVVFDFKNRGKN